MGKGRTPMTCEEILQAVARGWCHPTTEHLTMDPVLAVAIADEIRTALDAARTPNHNQGT